MTHRRIILAALLAGLPLAATADMSADELPPSTVWYLHADLEQMRTTDSGRELYRWLDGEIFAEVNDQLGIDINAEVDRVTAFSDTGEGAVIIVEGAVSSAMRRQILEIAADDGELDKRDYRGKTYYLAGDGRSSGNGLEALEDSSFFTFDVKGKIIASSDEDRLKALIDSNGRIAGADAHKNALFVLTADKQFVQAGMRTSEFADDEDDWDSNILRNTEQAALLVSDKGGMIAIEAKLVSTDPSMATSIGNIISGLISLQAFNADIDASLAGVLQNTRVDVVERVLSVSTVIEPALIVSILER